MRSMLYGCGGGQAEKTVIRDVDPYKCSAPVAHNLIGSLWVKPCQRGPGRANGDISYACCTHTPCHVTRYNTMSSCVGPAGVLFRTYDDCLSR